MVTLNTMLLVGLIVAVLTSVVTVALFMLLGVYLGIKEIRAAKAKENEEDDNGVFTIPMSALSGGMPRNITQADINEARAKWAAHQQAGGAPGAPGAPDEGKKAEYEPGEGAYL